MPNFSPLDMPLEEGRVVVRQNHSTFMEVLIGVTNSLFILLFTVVFIWGTLSNGFSLFLFVPYVFALIIGLVVCSFLLKWRKYTLLYEQTGEVANFKKDHMIAPNLFTSMALFFWGLYLLFFVYNLFSGNVDSWRLFSHYLFFMLPGLILGPVQYLYLNHLNKLRSLILAYDRNK